MAGIPPNSAASVVGGMAASGRAQAAKTREARDEGRTVDRASFKDSMENVIAEEKEGDMTVDADSGGGAGQGRNFSESKDEEQSEETPRESHHDGALDIEA